MNPDDATARMLLADHYVGKLMTVSGPEQGLWGGRAEAQWQSVVDLDDGHWRAHASLGVNYSYYPEVMGKRSDALRHLERALEIQRTSAPEPGHVQTYVYLARLRAQAGEAARAREILNEGLARHPGDATLVSALAELGS
jgi:tetratricopeptide (TPR) repeat protein